MIKLHTTLGEEPKLTILYEWPRNVPKLLHDAAVAHAYQEAVKETPPSSQSLVEHRVAELLKSWGVEP